MFRNITGVQTKGNDMQRTLTRRMLLAAGFLTTTFACVRGSVAAELNVPTGKPILTITGKIDLHNQGDAAVFDRPMLEALGTVSFKTSTPWYDVPVTFEGIRMTDLLRTVGAHGDHVAAIALNDYATDIPVDDFDRYGVIMALKRDGAYMPVRDKGPLFIVYPYDTKSELKQQKYYARSAWQVSQLVVK